MNNLKKLMFALEYKHSKVVEYLHNKLGHVVSIIVICAIAIAITNIFGSTCSTILVIVLAILILNRTIIMMKFWREYFQYAKSRE